MSESSDVCILGGADGIALTADRYSEWIATDGFTDINVHITWVGTGTPVGSWKIELSNDPVIATEQARHVGVGSSGMGVPSVRGASSTAKVVDISSSISPVFGTGFSASGGVTGSTMFALTAGVSRYFRVWFDHSSGGSAASLAKVWVHKV